MNTGFVRSAVATVLTVYGIETAKISELIFNDDGSVATVLTVYGIETNKDCIAIVPKLDSTVATVLTVYGIET